MTDVVDGVSEGTNVVVVVVEVDVDDEGVAGEVIDVEVVVLDGSSVVVVVEEEPEASGFVAVVVELV